MKTRTRRRCLVALATILGIAVLVYVSLLVGIPRYKEHARKAWKEAALPEIRGRADDPAWVLTEISMLGGTNSGTWRILAEHWLTDRLILMKNGQWLVYKSHCSKVPPHAVSDIFLAKGSDGKWYYSTCHFCVGMCVLLMLQDVPPPDIATFARCYHLKEFDGLADECLKETQTSPDFKAIQATMARQP